MDNKVNYTVVGSFVIALGIVAVAIFLWLTAMKQDRFTQTYVTYVRDDVSGLNVQSSVRFNGVPVGYVSSILLNKKDSQQVEIIMQLEPGTPVTTSTVATLNPQGITGLDYVGLKAKTPDAPPLRRQPGQEYPVISSEPSFLMRLSTVVKEVTDSISQLTEDVNQVLDKKNREALADTLANLDKITYVISANSQEINHSLKSMKEFFRNSANASKQLPQLLQNFNQTLAAMTDAANSGKAVAKTLDSTASSVNEISQQLVPSTQQLLHRLNGVATTLQSLSRELAEDPAMLVRGKNLPAPGPGEK